jgi:hypothetical protein
MALTVVGLLWFFRRKGWIGGESAAAAHRRRTIDSRNDKT